MKKLFVVVVTDGGYGVIDSPEIFHIKANGPHSAVRCVRDTFKEDDDLDFVVYELKDVDIIEA